MGLRLSWRSRREPLVGEAPVKVVIWRGSPPEDQLAQGANSEPSKAVEIFDAVGLSRAIELFEVMVADPLDSAFNSTPKFGGIGVSQAAALCRRYFA